MNRTAGRKVSSEIRQLSDVKTYLKLTEKELKMIREVIDPLGFFVKKPQKAQVVQQF